MCPHTPYSAAQISGAARSSWPSRKQNFFTPSSCLSANSHSIACSKSKDDTQLSLWASFTSAVMQLSNSIYGGGAFTSAKGVISDNTALALLQHLLRNSSSLDLAHLA